MTPICNAASILVSLCHYDQNTNRNVLSVEGRVRFGSVSEHFSIHSGREDIEVGRMWEDFTRGNWLGKRAWVWTYKDPPLLTCFQQPDPTISVFTAIKVAAKTGGWELKTWSWGYFRSNNSQAHFFTDFISFCVSPLDSNYIARGMYGCVTPAQFYQENSEKRRSRFTTNPAPFIPSHTLSTSISR